MFLRLLHAFFTNLHYPVTLPSALIIFLQIFIRGDLKWFLVTELLQKQKYIYALDLFCMNFIFITYSISMLYKTIIRTGITCKKIPL